MNTLESIIALSIAAGASYYTVEYVNTMSNDILETHQQYQQIQQDNIKKIRGLHVNTNQ